MCRLLAAVTAEWLLPVQVLYGGGLRLMEGVRLRVQDLDMERRAAEGQEAIPQEDLSKSRSSGLPHGSILGGAAGLRSEL